MFGALVGMMDLYRKLDGDSQTPGSSLSQTQHDRFHSPQQRQLERSRSRVKNTVVLTPTAVWRCIVMNTFKEKIYISKKCVLIVNYWVWMHQDSAWLHVWSFNWISRCRLRFPLTFSFVCIHNLVYLVLILHRCSFFFFLCFIKSVNKSQLSVAQLVW